MPYHRIVVYDYYRDDSEEAAERYARSGYKEVGEFAVVGGLSVRAVYTDRNHWFTLVDYAK